MAQALANARTRMGEDATARVFSEALSMVAGRLDQVTVAVTGEAWLGDGRPSVERTIAELIAGARHELLLTAYSVTSGSGRVWEGIERALATGIRTSIVVDRIAAQSQETRLLLARLARVHPATLSLFDFMGAGETCGLHAKALVADRCSAIVGSANLSHRGLVVAHEMAVVVRGPTAARVASAIDALLMSHLVVRVS